MDCIWFQSNALMYANDCHYTCCVWIFQFFSTFLFFNFIYSLYIGDKFTNVYTASLVSAANVQHFFWLSWIWQMKRELRERQENNSSFFWTSDVCLIYPFCSFIFVSTKKMSHIKLLNGYEPMWTWSFPTIILNSVYIYTIKSNWTDQHSFWATMQ